MQNFGQLLWPLPNPWGHDLKNFESPAFTQVLSSLIQWCGSWEDFQRCHHIFPIFFNSSAFEKHVTHHRKNVTSPLLKAASRTLG